MIVHLRTRHSGSLRRWLQVGLLVTAGIALGYCAVIYVHSALFQAYESRRFDRERASAMPELIAPSEAPPKVGVPEGAGTSRPASVPRPMIRRKMKEGATLGRLEVPRLKISVMVVEGVTDRELRLAAGHIPGTALPEQVGNVGIAGHRDTFFRELRNLQERDTITFTTRNQVFHYAVNSLSVVEPSATEVLAGSNVSELTLVTCFPFSYVGTAPRRFIVRAQRVD